MRITKRMLTKTLIKINLDIITGEIVTDLDKEGVIEDSISICSRTFSKISFKDNSNKMNNNNNQCSNNKMYNNNHNNNSKRNRNNNNNRTNLKKKCTI